MQGPGSSAGALLVALTVGRAARAVNSEAPTLAFANSILLKRCRNCGGCGRPVTAFQPCRRYYGCQVGWRCCPGNDCAATLACRIEYRGISNEKALPCHHCIRCAGGVRFCGSRG